MPTIDVREIPPRDRHRTIFDSLDTLAPGEQLEIIADHRPSPLRYELEATRPGQFVWADAQDGPDVFSALVTCKARILDVRPMLASGDEPFDLIMETVNGLEPGQDFVVIAPFEPVPLEGVLSSQGFTYDAAELEDGAFRVTFHPGG